MHFAQITAGTVISSLALIAASLPLAQREPSSAPSKKAARYSVVAIDGGESNLAEPTTATTIRTVTEVSSVAVPTTKTIVSIVDIASESPTTVTVETTIHEKSTTQTTETTTTTTSVSQTETVVATVATRTCETVSGLSSETVMASEPTSVDVMISAPVSTLSIAPTTTPAADTLDYSVEFHESSRSSMTTISTSTPCAETTNTWTSTSDSYSVPVPLQTGSGASPYGWSGSWNSTAPADAASLGRRGARAQGPA